MAPDLEQEIYLEIGSAVAANTLGLKPRSDEETRRLGEKWFKAALKTIKSKICHDSVRTKLAEHKDPSELAAAVADVLLTCSFPSYIPILSVSRLCVYVGLSSICSGEKS
jgi:hypothetical protein